MALPLSSQPPLLVPSLLWGGGGDGSNLYKVPFHTFGTSKRRYLRLKPFGAGDPSSWVEVAVVDEGRGRATATGEYRLVRAARPLALAWDDPKSDVASPPSSSPFKKMGGGGGSHHDLPLEDVVRVSAGNRTPAFQAYVARNGSWSVPSEVCCFSLLSDRRSVDFYVSSSPDGRDAERATAWRDSLRTLLDNFHRWRRRQDASLAHDRGVPAPSAARMTVPRWDPKLHAEALFEAAREGDEGTLRWFFDHGCPVDFMDDKTGDTVLIVACRLGLLDVAKLALLGYHARNDPHPDFGKTALQTAVSAGHANIVGLIVDTAAQSGADGIISNHVDDNGEAPVHVAARCGSLEVLELLASHGADLGLVDGRGRTCLHCAAQAGRAECLSLALDGGADTHLEATSSDGFTALHLAARSGRADCVEALLRAGANVAADAPGRRSAYDLVPASGGGDIMRLLLDYDVSNEGSCSDESYDYDDGSSSLSSEEEADMFKGLNTYTVSPAGKQARNHSARTSLFGGSLVSPVKQQPPLAPNYYGGTPLFPGGAIPLHSQWPQINNFPVVGPHQRPTPGGGSAGNWFPQQSMRFNGPHHDAVEYAAVEEHPHSNGGEAFYHRGETWVKYVTVEGDPYWYNESRDSSTWEDPRMTSSKSVSFVEHGPNAASPSLVAQEPSVPIANEGGARTMLGQSHVMQSPATYAKKLTAIPLAPQRLDRVTTPGNASMTSSPSSTLALVPSGVHEDIKTSEAQHPLDSSPNTSSSTDPQFGNAPALEPRSTEQQSTQPQSEETDAKIMLLSHKKSHQLHLIQSQHDPAPEEKLPSTSKQSTQPELVERVLLAKTKSHTANTPSPFKGLKDAPTTQEKTERADPKSALLAHIKSRAVTDTGTSQRASGVGNKPLANNPGIANTTTQSSDDRAAPQPDGCMEKYKRMIAVGVPLPSVCHKMKQDGISEDGIERIKALSQSGGVVSKTTSSKSPDISGGKSPKRHAKDRMKSDLNQDDSTKKFMRMVAVGVPAEAVAHKMKSEGVEGAKIDMFKELHGLVSTTSLPPPPSQTTPNKYKYTKISKGDLAKDSTFSKYVKMSKVGVPLMAIVTKMSQDGLDKEKIRMFSAAFGLKTSSTTSPLPPLSRPAGSRRASKAMQKIHWTTVAEERLRNSLWESDSAEDEIKDCEIEKLESLFSASPMKKAGLGHRKNASKCVPKRPTSLIDPKRANNIAIALAQYRAFPTFDDLCLAVASLDGKHLNIEKLSNMQLLLPKPEEERCMKSFKGRSEGLGRAENWFIATMKIPRFAQKLAAFKYLLQFDEQTESLKSSLNKLAKACDEVVESKKLAGILRRLLAIGNLMNESAGKPQAKGITLDSLIKTAKKKGTDGKTTVLDLLVSTAMNNNQDIVEFWFDMPTVQEARLDLDDFRLLLREIKTGALSIDRSLEAEKSHSESQCGDSSEKFIQQLGPFLRQATGEIERVESIFSCVEGKVQLLCSFFAEDVKTCKASTIFGVLTDFSRLVNKSKEGHIRKEKAKKRRESLTRNKVNI
ncbi:hypothetical protein ACHAWF_013903 [Thalassiosira exigua]